ncbi:MULTISPECIES: serine/threonine-protein kinase [unclassified Corallococcus]|uniref:serine/threonine-protein kinase n=1 Tax=unclassified Corallococcus TaxID=2685029 RepID=UPI001A901026|nr:MULTISPECIES: serine/threonine-protein kinase [unclassified Corallococcus]MBN9684347.1 protein kinase [Corallococcus sp. NCSPR001]WAS84175.1 protein kinase [Corallococcus sp. NCRR]
MHERYEEELRVAQARGVVSPEEAEALLAEGRRAGRDPLARLVEDGVISEETLAAIRATARDEVTPHVPPPAPLEQARETPPQADGTTFTRHPSPEAAQPPAQEPAFPVPGWERYQPVRFLGQGGMGRVYLAYDPLLRRHVALKFVRGEDPELVRRFGAEAQAQARVEHERVCKVYEVGEVRGQPFIAMQYIQGRPLLEVARELSVEQTVKVVQQATEGVHAAHRAGLIHRDIKPSNILVERGEDGQWKPYVMDFGLARDWQREHTVTGTVLGTVHYMAPEQARGDVHQLDRRADVYSLGATLYVLLTGKTPIPGNNNLEVLAKLATQDPRPLRELNKNVPSDLEAIVLKCLEREPAARYDSARALSEDLERFLNGEPVKARAVGHWYRLRKRARKHRALVAMASVTLVLVCLAMGQVVLTRRHLGMRENLARRFAELSSEVEYNARLMTISRLHDTSAERQLLREKLKDIEREMQAGGEPALGPGHYALGKGWLDLGEPARAREHLEAAWQSGFQQPRVASAMSLALGQLYNLQLRGEQLAGDQLLGAPAPEQLKARRDELARRYRDPALFWLRQSQDALVLPAEYMSALLAFYEERSDEALLRLDALGQRLPWFYEALKLRGDILFRRAMVRWDGGGRTPEERALVQADLEAARRSYVQVADTAQSWPEAHYALAAVEVEAISMDLYDAQARAEHARRAFEHLARALKAAPDHAPSWALQATLHRNLARLGPATDAEASLRKATDSARRALELAPSNLLARKELGMDLWALAAHRQSQGLDPREALAKALEVLESVAPADRDYYIHHALALTFMTWADHEEQLHLDARDHRDRAIEAFQKVLGLAGRYQAAWNNLAAQYYQRASAPGALTVDEDLGQAEQALKKSLALNPRSVAAHFQTGRLQLFRAQRLRDRDADPRPALAAVREACRLGLAINPRIENFSFLEGLAFMDEARDAWERGESPLPLIEQARHSFERARSVAPESADAYNNLSHLHATGAVYQQALGQDPSPSLQAAVQASREALKRAPEQCLALSNLGRALRLQATALMDTRRDPGVPLSKALGALQQAIAHAPGDKDATLYLAEAQALRARWRKADRDFEEAARTYQSALSLSGGSLDFRLALAHFYREWAAWRQQSGLDASGLIEQGLLRVGEVLEARPSWAEAQALRANLQLLQNPFRAESVR